MTEDCVRWLASVSSQDVDEVGGNNASLGEMIGKPVGEGARPDGFATTATAYRSFINENDLESRIRELIAAWESGEWTLEDAVGPQTCRMLTARVFR